MAVTEIMRQYRQGIETPYGLLTSSELFRYEQILLEKGFFFLLVTNGTAVLSDGCQNYMMYQDYLLVVTPSIRVVLTDMSPDFSLSCLYIFPDYFDTLSVGQLVYSQVSPLIGGNQLPFFCLRAVQADYLRTTLALFDRRLGQISLYRDGVIRHLCSFLLLQIADALYQSNCSMPVCVKRSSEIFRHFKRLLVHHYREQHTIGYYADRLNISTTYLSRIVRSITGHTVRFHISELLYADARKLLECTDKDVKEIADELGFSDQSVFGKFFVRKTGLSPLKFRMRRG